VAPELKASQAKHSTTMTPNGQDVQLSRTVRILLYLFSRKQISGERPTGPFQLAMAITNFPLFY